MRARRPDRLVASGCKLLDSRPVRSSEVRIISDHGHVVPAEIAHRDMEKVTAFLREGQACLVAGQAVEEVVDCLVRIDESRRYAIPGVLGTAGMIENQR